MIKIIIIGTILVMLILTFAEDTEITEKKIIYVNSTQKNFNMMDSGSMVYPSHPLLGWIILITFLMIIYQITRKILGG